MNSALLSICEEGVLRWLGVSHQRDQVEAVQCQWACQPASLPLPAQAGEGHSGLQARALLSFLRFQEGFCGFWLLSGATWQFDSSFTNTKQERHKSNTHGSTPARLIREEDGGTGIDLKGIVAFSWVPSWSSSVSLGIKIFHQQGSDVLIGSMILCNFKKHFR